VKVSSIQGQAQGPKSLKLLLLGLSYEAIGGMAEKIPDRRKREELITD
jgi:hypothetical protein